MSRTISSSYTSGIVLTSTANNPVKVTGRISVSSGIALEGTPGSAFSWTVDNYGTIISNAISPVSTALFLGAYTTSNSTGTVVNEAGGLITGSGYGVFINAATGASVINLAGGTIAGGAFKSVYISGGLGTVVNGGVLLGGNVAVYEYKGGTVTNLSTGTITGNGGIWLQQFGTIINAGTIASTNASRGAVVFNSTTGSSRVIVDPGAVFNGDIQSLAGSTNVVELAGTVAGTLAGFNGTTITNFATLQFDTGAKWKVSGNSLAAGLGTLAITGFTINDTIDLTGFVATSETFGTNQVVLTNAATQHATLHLQGSFSSGNLQFTGDGLTGTNIIPGAPALGHTLASVYTHAVTLASPGNNPFYITGAGGIAPTVANATALYAPGGHAWTITNAGTVTGGTSLGTGIVLGAAVNYVGATTITNQAGGRLTGSYGVRMYNSAASSVVNQAGATITATELTGVYIGGVSTGTITNAGVILAPPGKYAVLIATESVNNRVIADPGAVFTGKIGGGAGVMELASGASTGTLAGFGPTITNFGSLQFDTGAAWTISGDSASTGLGTLAIGGFTVADTIELTGFAAVSETFASNALVLTNAATVHTTLHVQGTLTTANFNIATDGGGGTDITFAIPPASLVYGQTLDQAGIVATSETVTAGTMTLFNGVSAVGTVAVGTSLNSGDFTLRTDGAGGTDVIVSSVFGTYASGVTLLTNPTTIASTAHVSGVAPNSRAVAGPAGTAWAVTNQGTITDSGNAGFGIYLDAGGTAVNSANIALSGTATGSFGIYVKGAGGVTNLSTGTITAAGAGAIAVTGAGNVVNNGTLVGKNQVVLGLALLTVANTGVVLGVGAASTAVQLSGGGNVTNSAGGTISGGSYGINIQNAGTVENSGTVLGTAGAAVYLSNGTVINAGSIADAGASNAVYIAGAGSVTNLSTGMITAPSLDGINVRSGGDVVNNGTILSGFYGIAGLASLTVTNTGVILGTGANRSGVQLNGGFITNSGSGTIIATGGVADANNLAATVVNSGTIEGTSSRAIYLHTGTVVNSGVLLANGAGAGTLNRGIYIYGNGNVTNLSTGTITGHTGVFFGGGYTGTLNNSGTIVGTGSLAVTFNGGGTHRVIDNPGAVFTGGIYGGTFASATMELASGGSVGTISGFGSTITNFNTLAFDSGAQWIVAGNASTIGLGTLGISGFATGDTIDLTGFVAVGDTFGTNVVTFTNAASATATLNLLGSFSGANLQFVADGSGGTDVFLGAGGPTPLVYGQTIDQAGIVATSETVTAGTMTLFNGVSAAGTIAVGTSLNSGDFSLRPDGASGTDVIVSTVFGTYAAGVTLLTNPATIASTASVGNATGGGRAVSGPTGTTWTLTNQGAVSESGANSIGISFAAAGTVLNAGSISAANGVEMLGGGNLTNSSTGRIASTTGYDVLFSGLGGITNYGTIQGSFRDIRDSSFLSVTNTGLILATGSTSFAVNLLGGGFVTNGSDGTISGGNYGIRIAGAASTIENSGTILGTAGAAVYISAGTLTNSGLIAGIGVGGGIYLGGTGSVTNQVGGRITVTASTAVELFGAGTVTNNGTMQGSGAIVVGLASLTVGNTGIILSTGTGAAVSLSQGGVVYNSSTGTISGGRGVAITNLAGSLINSGTIAANAGIAVSMATGTLLNFGVITAAGTNAGIYIHATGTVANLAGGTISGGRGLLFAGGYSDTVFNSGTIIGSNGTAVAFAGGGSHLVIDNPGAVFTGAIYGGATTGSTAVMELASGASAGTLIGFDGSSIVNFTSLAFDTGAQWTVTGGTAASGLGTIGISGFATGDTIDLTGFVAVGDTFGTNLVTFTNAASATATLNLLGSFSGANLQFAADGSGGTDVFMAAGGPAPLIYGQTIDQAGIIATSETVTAGTMTLFNGASAVGTIAVGTSLNSGDFTLRSDGGSGTEIIVSTVFGSYVNGVTLLTNPTTIASTATVANAADGGSALTGPIGIAWTVNNLGTVTETGIDSVAMYLRAGGTVANAGKISIVEGAAVIAFVGTGNLTNLSTGTIANSSTIAADYGVRFFGAGNVTNSGTITGGSRVVHSGGLLTVTNTGAILTIGTADTAVRSFGGGFVTNSVSGTISGGRYGVEIVDAAGTVENSGTILASNGYAIVLSTGTILNANLIAGGGALGAVYFGGTGGLTNLASGTITAAKGVVFAGSGNDTVSNFGTIAGTGGTAVSFGSANGRLIDNPGAVFTGAIFGGGSGTAVMELASAASTGTISGFGTTVTNFASLVFDTGARWIVTGDTAASGLGTIGISGFATGDTIDLTGFVAVGDTFGTNVVTFTNAASAIATLNLEGAFSSANLRFAADGSGGTEIFVGAAPALVYGQTIDQAGIVATSETVTAGMMTLFNGASAVGTIAVGTSLNSGDFTLRSDGGSGTEIIVSTVFGSYVNGVTLLTNPTTIASAASVGNAANNSAAVTGPSGTAWIVTNLGTITESGTNSYGLNLASGGTVVNAGKIADSGQGTGVRIAGTGSVTNQSGGTITVATNAAIDLIGGGDIVNNGTLLSGSLGIGGGGVLTVTNTGVVLANHDAVTMRDGSVTNSLGGIIQGGGYGILLEGAGTITNGGTIQGTGNDAIYILSGVVTNSGSIGSGGDYSVYIDGAGSVTNQVGGTITNAGTKASVIAVLAGGNVTNAGTLKGGGQVVYGGGLLTVTNSGVIQTTVANGEAVTLAAGGLVTNSVNGTIGARFGIIISGTGTVANSGKIAGYSGSAIDLYSGTVGNSGYIASGGLPMAVYLHRSGSVTNVSAGTIAGYGGVGFGAGFSDTLVNAGTIIGGGGTAVSFNGAGTHHLIVDPGAVFHGAIFGGTGATSVFELASGASAGTISGFGGTITNFSSLAFDTGARWTVVGNDFASGLGTLGVSGFAAGDTIDLTGFAAVSGTFANNSLILTDAVSNHATLAIQGGFSSADFRLGTDGSGGTDIALQTAPVITGTVANQGVPNETPSNPFATVTESDPRPGAIDTVTITLSTPGNGTLANLSTGTYDSSTGVYRVTGTPAIDTAALRALVFTPIEQPNTDVVTTGFAISPGEGGVTDTTTNVTSVRQILGLAAVPLNQIAISVSPDGTGFAAAAGGKTNEAVVIDPVAGASYTVPTGYQALFLGGTADATLSDASVGNALLVANAGNDQLVAGAPNDVLVAGSGSDSLTGGDFDSTVIGGSGPATVFAGSGVMHVFEGSGPIVFGGNGNAGSTVLGGSGPGASPLTANLTGQNQTVSVGGSASTITAAGSGNSVVGGSSTLNVTVSGTANTIQAGSGSSTVVSGGSGTMINGGSGPLVVMETGDNNTISGGASPTTVTASTATFVVGGSGGLTFVGGLGTATVVGGGGANTVTAGAGGLIFNVGASDNATVNSGSGTVSIFGAPGTTVNLVGTLGGSAGHPNYAVAGGGSETVNASGSAGSDWLSVNTTVTSSAATLIAGSGNDTLIAGSAPGSTTMTGGNGSDAFVFFKQAVGGAHDVINDFTAGDAVFIEGYGAGSAATLQNASSVSANGLTLTLSDGTTVTFSNLTSQHALDGHVQYG